MKVRKLGSRAKKYVRLKSVTAGSLKELSPYEGRFGDPHDARDVLVAIGMFFRDSSRMAGFAIESMEVRPVPDSDRVRLETRFASGSVTIHLPRPKGEGAETFHQREVQILVEFQKTIFEAQMRSAWEFYWSLDTDGKRLLLEGFRGDRP